MKYSQYQEMLPKDIEDAMVSIAKIWEQFIEGIKDPELPSSEQKQLFSVNSHKLKEIVIRVNKKAAYFQFFHKDMKISEYKEAAFYAFWIIKWKPFSLSKEFKPYEQFAAKVNEEFALYYILTTLKNIAQHESKSTDLDELGESMYRELVYSFQYRDISKDAMILIVELIAKIVNK
jgi:hypothetical protein